jgi:hypothetical protein
MQHSNRPTVFPYIGRGKNFAAMAGLPFLKVDLNENDLCVSRREGQAIKNQKRRNKPIIVG